MNQFIKNKKGTTFIELLLYISIFMIIIPVFVYLSINTTRQERQHMVEKQVSVDSQFMIERIYDIIADTKKVDVNNSRFDDLEGKLTLVMQDDSEIIIEMDSTLNKIEITEDGVKSDLSTESTDIESLYFERIVDELNDPEIVLGITVRLNISGVEEYDLVQNYVTSSNLERGDFDEDGCPDYLDAYPKFPECCGDADNDGICDELDNCVLSYNPFQEDYDMDEIGDECDKNAYGGSGNSGNPGNSGRDVGNEFNCNTSDSLINLINQNPPLRSATLKQILMSSSPLPPSVLHAIIDRDPSLENGHFKQVMIWNTKLPDDVLDRIVDMSMPGFHKTMIILANDVAELMPWLGIDRRDLVDYNVTLNEQDCEGTFYPTTIRFHNADVPLGDVDTEELADIFSVTVSDASNTVFITTKTGSGITTNTLILEEGNGIEDSLGFQTAIESIYENTYTFSVSSVNNVDPLDYVEFNFGCGASVTSPTTTYEAARYINYCEGGCAENCGDEGTGIITSSVYTDSCYRWNMHFPEWCSFWHTFTDDNTEHPAYLGGTQEGVGDAYWEKKFTTILSQDNLDELDSITVAGEIAYQSTAMFFCDTLGSECPMNGDLVDAQNVELYNWETEEWVIAGVMGLDGEISDQQIFEVVYNNEDVLSFVGGYDNQEIKARIQFHWNGVSDQNQTSAPCFMAIDYFTLHLKW
ncbi:MAG: hypothetical protein J7M01_03595 [Candidatus Marinimicrobia bacterium]|nr:hypothetical protein [Candidatus Neomarinimicrobiota bacterium]